MYQLHNMHCKKQKKKPDQYVLLKTLTPSDFSKHRERVLGEDGFFLTRNQAGYINQFNLLFENNTCIREAFRYPVTDIGTTYFFFFFKMRRSEWNLLFSIREMTLRSVLLHFNAGRPIRRVNNTNKITISLLGYKLFM